MALPAERLVIWEAFQTLTAAALNGEMDMLVDAINDIYFGMATQLASIVTSPVSLKVIPDTTALTTGDGKYTWVVPVEYNNNIIVTPGAHVFTASTSGTPTIQISRDRAGVVTDVLTTPITIDVNEKDSKDATVPPSTGSPNNVIQTGDVIRIDVDVAGTNTAGLEVRFGVVQPGV